jgi:hypothetical protein
LGSASGGSWNHVLGQAFKLRVGSASQDLLAVLGVWRRLRSKKPLSETVQAPAVFPRWPVDLVQRVDGDLADQLGCLSDSERPSR